MAELRDRFARETDPAKLAELSDEISALSLGYADFGPDDEETLAAFRLARKARG